MVLGRLVALACSVVWCWLCGAPLGLVAPCGLWCGVVSLVVVVLSACRGQLAWHCLVLGCVLTGPRSLRRLRLLCLPWPALPALFSAAAVRPGPLGVRPAFRGYRLPAR